MTDHRVFREQTKAAIKIEELAKTAVKNKKEGITLDLCVYELQQICSVSNKWAEKTIRAACKKHKLKIL